VVDDDRAEQVRWIFARFLEIGSATELARELAQRGLRTTRGNRIGKTYLYRLLNNRAYIGEAVHKGDSYPGEHDACGFQKYRTAITLIPGQPFQ